MSRTTSRLRVELHKAGVSLRAFAAAAGFNKSSVHECLALKTRNPHTREELLATAVEMGLQLPDDFEPWAAAPVPEGGFSNYRRPTRRVRKATSTHLAQPAPTAEGTPDVIPTKLFLAPAELQHFGLSRDPFMDRPGERLFISDTTRWIRSTLLHGIETRSMMALIGEVGAGKSTALRLLHSEIVRKSAAVCWMTPGNLNRAQINEGALATAMLRDLGCGDYAGAPAEKRGETLRTAMSARVLQGELLLLAIDEAHDLTADGLIACKRLWDSYTFDRSVSILLVGQRTLKQRLEQDPSVREVAARTSVVEIPSFSTKEIAAYLHHRLEAAGRTAPELFDAGACAALGGRAAAVSRPSGSRERGHVGPLWINALAARALRYAHRRGLSVITADVVGAC